MAKAPYQIKRHPGSEPGTFEFHLVHVPTGRLVLAEYRLHSPVPPARLRKSQAALNTQATLFLAEEFVVLCLIVFQLAHLTKINNKTKTGSSHTHRKKKTNPTKTINTKMAHPDNSQTLGWLICKT